MTSDTGKSSIRLLLRLEGALVACIGLYLFNRTSASWWLFAALILAPDLSFAGYMRGTEFGASVYNAAHTYLAPALLWTGMTVAGLPFADELALIWIIHIGADRLLGYGLKYADAFRHTHLSDAPGNAAQPRAST